ncbi:hypothetical protein HFE03_03500 [Paenibacillus sp. EKM102P]|uniref:hypothetical protein n=1 Tax=unclassified Paenibacillus TaxID=185978 RepID=UPI00142E270B|nr:MULTISPECIES: hypothetical protein [unclassified Paenibacillus]KAF6618275.1 hypothetical protein HFE00_09340 [Paenibacillus sp. EKM101P]KAF6624620.1 hypothetical protein HFE03_03500 [Paenibacillus sp. EKM102P]KAF6635601.1 hypothetical protein HFE01_01530 [Paenibacillus sp. EKM10P]KAF6648689.1 hypothetical protein HFE02_10020 [Paenibacillus sp. EKM11P]
MSNLKASDFQEIEHAAVERYLEMSDENLSNEETSKVVKHIAMISAQVATFAIQEYHRKLQQKSEQ